MTENPRSRYKVSPGRTLSMPLVRFEHLGNMARIILARPNAGNAINAAFWTFGMSCPIARSRMP